MSFLESFQVAGTPRAVECACNDPGRHQFAITQEPVAGAEGKFTQQKNAVADIFYFIAHFLYLAEHAALLLHRYQLLYRFKMAMLNILQFAFILLIALRCQETCIQQSIRGTAQGRYYHYCIVFFCFFFYDFNDLPDIISASY